MEEMMPEMEASSQSYTSDESWMLNRLALELGAFENLVSNFEGNEAALAKAFEDWYSSGRKEFSSEVLYKAMIKGRQDAQEIYNLINNNE
jgi:hypothetical protein